MKDYSKIKALAQNILECIGDDEEGEDPKLPKQNNDIDGAGVEANTSFLKTKESDEKETGVGKGKKSKDASLAMMGSMLASKFNK
jgi:hypothetical protein